MDLRKHRQSNIELLRIFAMILIISHHLAVHSGFSFEPGKQSVNALFIQLLSSSGKIGVNVFVLISGYFLVNQQDVSIVKILKLWGQIFFYSIALYLFNCIIGIQTFQPSALLQAMQPISSSLWWFASTYFVLYLLSPFISTGLCHLSKKKYIYLLFLLMFLWCIIPSVLHRPMEGNNLLWFIALYCIGGYLRKYGLPINTKRSFIITFLLFLLTYVFARLADVENTRYTNITQFVLTYLNMQDLLVLLTSIFLFWSFAQLDIGYSTWINKLASATFGVYLIHDIPSMRNLLWVNLLHNADFTYASILIIRSVILIFTVYIVCVLIDLIRIATIERAYIAIIKCAENRIQTIVLKQHHT